MVDKIKNMFSDGQGLDIYNKALSVIEKYKMNELMQKGTLVGLSGGADSVMLLCFLVYYRCLNGHFPITAVHVNHCIRGAEADRDEDFSRT
jgi:tRNA(Ile)-lysidine synthase